MLLRVSGNRHVLAIAFHLDLTVALHFHLIGLQYDRVFKETEGDEIPKRKEKLFYGAQSQLRAALLLTALLVKGSAST